MDLSRFFTILCAFLLLICLTFSITALVALRNVIAENRVLQNETMVLLERIKAIDTENKESVSVSTDKEPPYAEKAEADGYCMKAVSGIIGVFTKEGDPIRTLNTNVSLLPSPDREALEKGIFVETWKEMLALIQDYTN